MIDIVKIQRHLSNLRDYLGRLRDLAKASQSEFQTDLVHRAAAERLLQISIETCLNLGNHLIAAMSWRNPEDYADIFRVLGENRVIPSEFTESMVQMARFRNRLVHLYWELEPAFEYEILRSRLGDFEEFARCVVDFLERSGAWSGRAAPGD